ncbi:MAG: phage major capsid protein, partial [Actinomycetota bacterium]
MNTREKREQRARVWEQMKAILDTAEEDGGLTAARREDYDKLEVELDRLGEDIAYGERHDAHRKDMQKPDREKVGPPPHQLADRQDLKGRVSLRSDESVSDWVAAREGVDHEPLSFGRLLRGYVTGDWQNAEPEKRALSEGVNASGGFFVPTPLSASIIDKVRARARVFSAGATTVSMASQTERIARWAGDPTGSWRSEGAAIVESDGTLESVTLTARTLAVLTRASRELIEDAEGVDDQLEDAFAASLALELDRVALYGTGTAPEPRGVRNQSGVDLNSQGTNGAAITSWDPLTDAIFDVKTRNFDPNAIILSPRSERTLMKLKDTTNQPLAAPSA